MKNLELKTYYQNLNKAKRICIDQGAKYAGILLQTDTFFNLDKGRLKLRNINNKQFELIYYNRTNSKTEKISEYEIIRMQDEMPVKKILKEYLGIRGIVKKKRELYLYENVRIHLDTVRQLGRFLEFEIVCINARDLKKAPEKMKKLKKIFGISAKELISDSYIDMH